MLHLVRWREIRAGLIAFAIVLALVEGCPIPPPQETLPWQQGYVSIIRPIQKAIMTPFAWIPRTLRFTQRFALFQAAHPDRFRLEIRGRTATGTERILFRAGDDDSPYAALLTQRRVRGTWNPSQYATSQWVSFVKWFAERAFADHDDLQVIVFRHEKIRIENGVVRDTGQYAFDLYRYRGQQ